jgi:hypothetical protein
MNTFHVAIHARPASVSVGEQIQANEHTIQTLAVPSAEQALLFDISFEQVSNSLEDAPRLFIEPDGSFVWVSADNPPLWQIDGHLWDRNGRLFALELRGYCPENELAFLLSTIGWPQTQIMFRVIEHAVFIDEAGFRRWVYAL